MTYDNILFERDGAVGIVKVNRPKSLNALNPATLGDLTDTNKENLADALDIASMESNRDFQLRIRDRERVLIRKIKLALQRIDDGEYGYCISCGEEILEKRLIARPVATHCIDCKTEAEHLERRSRTL